MGSCCGKSKAVSPSTKQEVYRSRSPIIEKNDTPRIDSSSQHDYSAMQRISNIALTTNNPQQLMTGYHDEPRASLEEALQPVNGRMDHLSQHIKEAKAKCHHPSEHNLTRDESAAIYIYTMKWDNRCVHNQLQGALNSGDRSQLKPWFMYLKLLKSALDKLPTASTGIWQGTSFDHRLNEKFSSQSASLYTSLGSCSPSEGEIKKYLHKHSGPKTMLINYESVNGKLVTGYTASKSHEIIIWPGMKVGVSKYATVDDHGSIIAHLANKTSKYDFT